MKNRSLIDRAEYLDFGNAKGEPNSWDIGANFLNTPEPIITLTTKNVAALNPILGLSTSILQFSEFYIKYIIIW